MAGEPRSALQAAAGFAWLRRALSHQHGWLAEREHLYGQQRGDGRFISVLLVILPLFCLKGSMFYVLYLRVCCYKWFKKWFPEK